MSDPKKMTIEIEVTGGQEEALIRCNGEEYIVRGLALFADGAPGNLFSFFWASPLMAAQAVIKSCAEAYRREDAFAQSFYACLLRGFALATGSYPKPEEKGLEKLESWEKEDEKKTTFN